MIRLNIMLTLIEHSELYCPQMLHLWAVTELGLSRHGQVRARLCCCMTILLDEYSAIGPGSVYLCTYYSFGGNFKVLQIKVTHTFSLKKDNVN